VSQLPDSRTEVVSLSFGLLGSHPKTGKLIFDKTFNVDEPETQVMLVQVCDELDALVNDTARQTQLSFRRLNSCIMRTFAQEYVPQIGQIYPFEDAAELRSAMKNFVQINPSMRKYISFEQDTFRIQRVTIEIKTGFDKQMGAASAVEAMKIWDGWIDEYNQNAPAAAQVGMQSSFLWARSSTESAAIRGTLDVCLLSVGWLFGCLVRLVVGVSPKLYVGDTTAFVGC
jgi:hypothetical protein